MVKSLLIRRVGNQVQRTVSLLDPFVDVSPRFDGTLRLFRMILDVNHPAFQIEDRQWRPSVIEIFNRYFACIWKDPTVCLYAFGVTSPS